MNNARKAYKVKTLARYYFKRKKYEKTLEQFKKLWKIDPHFIVSKEILTRYAQHYKYNSSYQDAIKSNMSRWCESDAYGISESFMNDIAKCYAENKEYEKALEVTELALSLSPGNYENIESKMELLELLGRDSEAKEYRKKLQKIDKKTSGNTLLEGYLKHIETPA